MNRVRHIKHKTIKKKLDGVAEADAPFIEMAWNEETENEEGGAGRSFMEYLAQMDKKFPGGFDVMDEEDSPFEKQRKRVKALLDRIPEGAQKEIDKLLLKDMMGS